MFCILVFTTFNSIIPDISDRSRLNTAASSFLSVNVNVLNANADSTETFNDSDTSTRTQEARRNPTLTLVALTR